MFSSRFRLKCNAFRKIETRTINWLPDTNEFGIWYKSFMLPWCLSKAPDDTSNIYNSKWSPTDLLKGNVSLFHWRFGPKLKSVCSVQMAIIIIISNIFGQRNGRAGAQKFIQYQIHVWIFHFVTSSCFNRRILIGNCVYERLVFGVCFLLLFFFFIFFILYFYFIFILNSLFALLPTVDCWRPKRKTNSISLFGCEFIHFTSPWLLLNW